jgi:hypothetical protein
MNSAEQIEKLQSQARIFSEELLSLIQSFEMLRLVAEDKNILGLYSGTKRPRGQLNRGAAQRASLK